MSAAGLDCDIAFHNPLALSNTKLLYSYSKADPRVRPLAFVLKHWAKSRHINNPGEGTLSSYGYILLLIHFLQVSGCLYNNPFSVKPVEQLYGC